MATFYAGPSGADMRDLSALKALTHAAVHYAGQSSYGCHVQNGPTVVAIGGHGFTYNAGGGRPAGGTVEVIDVTTSGETRFTILDLDIDFSALLTALYNQPTGQVVASLFAGSDTILGDDARDFLRGFAGNDILNGGKGKDTLVGNAGFDTADYSDRTERIKVTLDGGKSVKVKVGGSVEDKLKGIEAVKGGAARDMLKGDAGANAFHGFGGDDLLDGRGGDDDLFGGDGNDRLMGGGGSDLLDGGAGKDKLLGGGGSDILNGGAGNDRLEGGGGSDSYVFDAPIHTANVDRVIGFKPGEDKIVVSQSVFGAGLGYGALSKSDFEAYFVYTAATGKLYHDRFATGGDAEKVLFAKLDPGTSLTHADFLVVG